MLVRQPVASVGLPVLLLLATACGGGAPSELEDVEPSITIEGVSDGAVYGETETVTIQITVAPGSYQATLNGATIFSGHTVTLPGEYTLVVEAQNGLATASRTVAFSLVEDGEDVGSVATIRLLDLGDNDAGGGGDAILISDSSESGVVHALVDAGPAGSNGSDPGYVARRVAELGVDTLRAVILTHAHSDHFAGLPAVLQDLVVQRFIYNGQVRTYQAYEDLITSANMRAGAVVVPDDLLAVDLNTTVLTAIPPLDTHLPVYQGPSQGESGALNDGSVGAHLERGVFDMFLTGDGEVEANRRWRTSFPDLSTGVEVLKVGHHGANDAIFDNGFSGASSWLDHTDPETMVISANGTTHPRLNALTKILDRSNTRTYCTNVHGEITIRVTGTGSSYAVAVERNPEMDCVAGDEATS